MASTFKCKEMDLQGRISESFYRADSKEEVMSMVRNKGHTPIKVTVENEEKEETRAQFSLGKKKVKIKDISIFCKQLSTMLNAGMPLLNSLEVLIHQSDNKTLRETLKDMANQVQKGEILSTTMRKHKSVFPPLLISMIEAGELTGTLDSVLLRMTEHYTKENRINNKIKGAMMYPMVLSILAVTIVVFLLVGVMPTFVGMFAGAGVELPLPTRILLGISDAIKSFWYLIIAAIVGIITFMKAILKTTNGKRSFDKLKLSIPGIKVNIAKIAASRFTRTLSTLLSSGIPILKALEAAATVTNNMVVIDSVAEVAEEIKKGTNLSALLRKVGIFPPMMISMISIGEESGSMEDMLEKTADYYDEELDAAIQKMISIIEPVMIIVMAVLVGFIVIAMMLPMFDMLKTVT